MKKRALFLIVFIIFITSLIFANDEAENTIKDSLKSNKKVLSKQDLFPEYEDTVNIFRNVIFDFGFLLSKAQAEFGKNVKNIGYGFNINLGYNFVPLPIIAGINLDFLTYGSEKRKIPYSYYTDLVTLIEETSNNIVMGHLLLRSQPSKGNIHPYWDGLIGFKYLYTETSIQGEDEEDEIASSINIDDFAFSYGLGCGIMMQLLNKSDKCVKSNARSLLITIGSRYLMGSNAEYLNVKKEGWIEISDPDEGPVTTILHPDNSKTDLLTFQIGFSILF